MKLNFWQILGIIILIVGIVLVFRRQTAPTDTVQPAPNAAPTTATTAP
jgi:hypothetical protein